MSPVINNNANASSSVQALRAVEQRTRSERPASGSASSGTDAVTTASAVVKINPAARELAQSDRASRVAPEPNSSQSGNAGERNAAANASRAAGTAAVANGNRLPTNVSAALKAYGATQQTPAAEPTQTTGTQAIQDSRSTTASNDPTGVTQAGRTKPVRASTQETADSAEKAQAREQRDQAANLQSAASATTRLANQSARFS